MVYNNNSITCTCYIYILVASISDDSVFISYYAAQMNRDQNYYSGNDHDTHIYFLYFYPLLLLYFLFGPHTTINIAFPYNNNNDGRRSNTYIYIDINMPIIVEGVWCKNCYNVFLITLLLLSLFLCGCWRFLLLLLMVKLNDVQCLELMIWLVCLCVG